MTILPVVDRNLPDRLSSLLAYQRREPIHIRLVSQHIFDFMLNGTSIFQILRRLKTKKNASISLLLDRKRYMDAPAGIKERVEELEEIGVRFHKIRNLHAKLVTVENNQEKCLLVTSANLSHRAYHEAHEVGIYCQDGDDELFDSFKRYISNLIKSQNQ